MNPNIPIDELMIMQHDLRNFTQIDEMIKYVSNGGFWTQDALAAFAVKFHHERVCPLMEIVFFPDGQKMVHDGHHRLVSTYLGGRDYVRGDEYVMKLWKYEDYLHINFDNRWVTPFDPRTHVRVADIGVFKKTALDLSKTDADAAKSYIRAHQHTYVEARKWTGVANLAQTYLDSIEKDQYVSMEK